MYVKPFRLRTRSDLGTPTLLEVGLDEVIHVGAAVLTGKSEDGAVSGGLAGHGLEGFRVAREHVEDGQQTRDALSRLDHFRQNVTTVL